MKQKAWLNTVRAWVKDKRKVVSNKIKEKESSKYDLLVLETCLVKRVIPYSWIVDSGVATHVCFLY